MNEWMNEWIEWIIVELSIPSSPYNGFVKQWKTLHLFKSLFSILNVGIDNKGLAPHAYTAPGMDHKDFPKGPK